LERKDGKIKNPNSPGLSDILKNTPATAEEMRRRVARVKALKGSAVLRVGGQFLHETNPELN